MREGRSRHLRASLFYTAVRLPALAVFVAARGSCLRQGQVAAKNTLFAGESMAPLELNLLRLAEFDVIERSYVGLIGLFFLLVGLISGAVMGYRHWAAEVNRLRLKIQILKRIQDE
jgi:hypothetical protein